MRKILVARMPCGCVASAYLDPNGTPEDIKDSLYSWVNQGLVVAYEERESLGPEKCVKHHLEQIDKRLAGHNAGPLIV